MNTSHTPTPYFIEQEGYSIVTRDGIQVATTEYALKRDYSESKCNTTFIVKACNNHAALVEALRELADEVRAQEETRGVINMSLKHKLNNALVALSAVEEG